MALRFNKEPLRKIGERVYYIGGYVSKNDTDKYTTKLMSKYLEVGSIYTIEDINNNLTYYCDHYFFKEEPTGGYCFPCNQFSYLPPRDYIRNKYNLK